MKAKFENLFRGYVLILLAVLFWSVWASAQPASATNAPTSAPGAPLAERQAWMTFGLNRVEVLQSSFYGHPYWEYLASLIYVLLAFLVAKLVDYIFSAWLKKLTARTKTQLDDVLVELAGPPIKVVSFVILLHFGLSIFSWPDVVKFYLSKAFIIVVGLSLLYVALKSVDAIVGLWRDRASAAAGDHDKTFNEQLFPILSRSLKVAIVVVGVLVTADSLGLKITGAIASLSVGGLALGLAAQDTAANLFGAVSVFVDKPFRIGDRIQVSGVDGTVEAIGLRSTRVRSLDGHLITVPNKTMGNATITNISRRPTIKTEMNFGLTYDTTTEQLRRALSILDEVYRAHPMTSDLWVSFNKFADSSLNILVIHWWKETDTKAYLQGMQDLNLHIKQRFDEAGIEFAFPSQTHYVKQLRS
ncbi:MAG: mechanosensitive ion channel family protein [Verrucomicrobia bacterium]|nr:mechanosensitive ion channel family protein [Verrucomicrobiota bacterium]